MTIRSIVATIGFAGFVMVASSAPKMPVQAQSNFDFSKLHNTVETTTQASQAKQRKLAGSVAAVEAVPAAEEAVQTVVVAEAVEPVAALPQSVTETVVAGDNLSRIANRYQTTYKRLYDANPQIAHPDMIKPGEVIRIPAADEQLAERALPVVEVTPVPVASVPKPAPASSAMAPADANVPAGVWDRLAQCESGGNWAINTGNGYYGGLQFSLSSWRGVGGSGYPHEASKAEQILRAEALLKRQGWGAWPACTAKLGLR